MLSGRLVFLMFRLSGLAPTKHQETIMTQSTKLENLSGYQDTRDLLVTRYNRGHGRSIFVIALPLHLIPSHLPKPDPEEPFPGNRTVDLPHARKFAHYWMSREDWACPPILLDTNAKLKFEVLYE